MVTDALTLIGLCRLKAAEALDLRRKYGDRPLRNGSEGGARARPQILSVKSVCARRCGAVLSAVRTPPVGAADLPQQRLFGVRQEHVQAAPCVGQLFTQTGVVSKCTKRYRPDIGLAAPLDCQFS